LLVRFLFLSSVDKPSIYPPFCWNSYASFDGKDEYVRVNNLDLSATSFTITLWARTKFVAENEVFFAQPGNGGTYVLLLFALSHFSEIFRCLQLCLWISQLAHSLLLLVVWPVLCEQLGPCRQHRHLESVHL
jgi:hypothetical protein